ncbi:Serum response factor-binding protein 1 [Nibea albiflora]|uniref:Serum response factor-binding protein 1 n=1 Tax=Nibea albiflora TaxID=240163 RepID=A0ACB7ESC0_NIBAL|nr:Serum response factor-binding protein 1 [Nibea albiflora]
MVLSAEGKEKEEEENPEEEEEEENPEEEEEEGDAGDEEEEEDGDEQEGGDGEKKEGDTMPPAAEKTEKPKGKKQSGGLNLNNEVVKMRKEVKRVRALIIRKLTRQIGALKKKKGKEAEIERNQRRADRLLGEIHAMKVLSPDLVTKTALQKKLNFEQECKNPKSTISDRAIARIATHPQFNKKIEDIKAAVKAFKDERMKGVKQGGKEKSAPEVFHKKKDKEESDLESSDDEEKEYFDDSTEERFHKQSSQSEESDDDDFFVGKVSKFKKKKKQKSVEGEKGHEKKEDPTDQVQSQLDELESRLKSKATSLQSIFCSSLSVSKPGGGRGAGRGRGGDKFRGQGKPRGGGGLNRDFSKQSKFQRNDRETERNSGSKFSKSESSQTVGRGRGRGRGNDIRQKDRRGGGVFSHQAPQQALHPSWEASKKRKEQQGQILAFQGKKIKFDDDD